MNIRQKIVLSIFVAFAGMGLLGSISYDHLLRIGEALRLAEVVDDLSNDILEVRRYEKNYLLYAMDEDYRESLLYVDKSLDIIRGSIAPSGDGQAAAEGEADFAGLRAQLEGYRRTFGELAAMTGKTPPEAVEKAQTMLREQGKGLVGTSRRIKEVQRDGILRIVDNLKRQLLLSTLALIFLGLGFSWVVGRRIITALHLIENTTRQVAKGHFQAIDLPASRDETRDVVKALNRMIVELDKRQNQLLQEKKLASLGVLTSGIAHQLNNPLNNISTSCQILREEDIGKNDAFVGQMLDNIHHEVLRSRDIVKGLLEFSRENEFSIKPTRLAEVVDRSVGLVAAQLPADVDIARRVPDDLCVPMDPQRMQEVFLNLFLNAAQAIGNTPGTITVSAGRDPEAGQAVIRVEDTGRGIVPEHLGRIFDPFFTLKEVGKGTGLGLSVVFGIVKKHGGTIVAESEPGQGAAFIIRLPLGAPACPRDDAEDGPKEVPIA
ncbi:sensor histidine kinase [Desulfolutivibrio sulfoxidireducens]|uniref:sensor histidine kinase n=1 Tax=Desulfolutivibrio sulfoxidireducens TaxID=2773299 RepID=UPI00159D6512|nr:HAMP domain-containing sensor histidine kinase [Desulfolutivibrio sulfoxidireducens]QLA17518.1 HAMP domain-containing protein [Desulfolutivibrio sulfoxidireducens]